MILIIFNFLDKFTDPLTQTKSKKYIYNLFIPIFWLLEYICYRYYWKNIVCDEILTSDVIVEFLEKNEFGYDGVRFKKAGLLSENEFFDRVDLKEAKELIKKEYVEAISLMFTENVGYNIEEYVNLLVTTEVKVIKHLDENIRAKIYTVTIQFCRQYFLDIVKRKLIAWFILIPGFILLTYFIINHYHLIIY